MIARKPLLLAFATFVAWSATCLVAVVIAPMPEVAIGFSEGAIWFERSTIGDTSPGALIRAVPSWPTAWYSHDAGTGWSNWSFPLWPVVVVFAAFSLIAFKRHRRTA